MLAVVNTVPMRTMGYYKEEPMAHSNFEITVKYIVVDGRNGQDLLVRSNLDEAITDCAESKFAYIRREVNIQVDDSLTVTSTSTLHVNLIQVDGPKIHHCPVFWNDVPFR